jgi:hypothetical protein
VGRSLYLTVRGRLRTLSLAATVSGRRHGGTLVATMRNGKLAIPVR